MAEKKKKLMFKFKKQQLSTVIIIIEKLFFRGKLNGGFCGDFQKKTYPLSLPVNSFSGLGGDENMSKHFSMMIKKNLNQFMRSFVNQWLLYVSNYAVLIQLEKKYPIIKNRDKNRITIKEDFSKFLRGLIVFVFFTLFFLFKFL